MSISLITPDPTADARRRTRLRQMRTVAVSLLVLAAVVYVATLGRDGWVGYVNAAAEASMVGAMADWFAVTALFKHPMGLPIPHTALIPKRKDELGRSLEEFVSDNFLQEQVIRDRLASADVSRRVGAWLSQEANADTVVREGATLLAIGLRQLRDEDVASIVTEVIVPRLIEEPVSPVAGRLLAEVVRDGAHHGFVDLVLEEGHRWLSGNHDTFTKVLGERAPWWSPPRLNEAVTDRLHLEALRWLADIRADPHHTAREALDSLLADLAEDLLADPGTQERAERLKRRVLEQPQLVDSSVSVWNALRKALIEALEEVDGPLRRRLVKELSTFGVRLGADEELRSRLDTWGADLAVFAVSRYGDEITAIITQTVERWDGKEAAGKIELHVGRDLQFIRINGTIVGGLVGLAIHTLSELIS
ncbi:membrane protein [Marmoricola endophyticus]|uniref:Membrane protein n=1 Tax=Marmoricola endophyticus TaxID=2040280 RepID=A0A917BFB0_9ACTN|nr:DUF445 domain-containing protein [Marmoricola endophyticus]GGF41295.1 membrane protein [Marmoricola endophyticus]